MPKAKLKSKPSGSGRVTLSPIFDNNIVIGHRLGLSWHPNSNEGRSVYCGFPLSEGVEQFVIRLRTMADIIERTV